MRVGLNQGKLVTAKRKKKIKRNLNAPKGVRRATGPTRKERKEKKTQRAAHTVPRKRVGHKQGKHVEGIRKTERGAAEGKNAGSGPKQGKQVSPRKKEMKRRAARIEEREWGRNRANR
jgi:hypothetical protein